ncbi:hypothetical protein [Borreliella burgdorferi]|nr:hypothetical protein [Borreliella burgdorferi]
MNSGIEYDKLFHTSFSLLSKSKRDAYQKSLSRVSNFSFWIYGA